MKKKKENKKQGKKPDIIGKSFQEYKEDSKKIFNIFLKTYAIPYIILFLIVSLIIFNFYEHIIFSLGEGYKIYAANLLDLGFYLSLFFGVFKILLSPDKTFYSVAYLTFPLALVLSLFYILFDTLMIYYSLNLKENTKKIFKEGKKYFFRLVGYSILRTLIFGAIIFTSIFLVVFLSSIALMNPNVALSVVMGIFIVLIILVSVFVSVLLYVYWIFTPYIIINKNLGVIESFKESYRFVRGRWWNAFLYTLIFSLIILAISILFLLLIARLGFLISVDNSIALVSMGLLLQEIISLVSLFIVVPLEVLFFKNLYLSYKK
jgi:hypothetical protein